MRGVEPPVLGLHPLVSSDRAEYDAWFADPQLDAQFGPAWTDEEFAQVMSDASGAEYVVESRGGMVAVFGLVLPTAGFARQIVASIAVQPALRRRGIGAAALRLVVAEVPIAAGAIWSAWVDRDNVDAIGFFTALGWTRVPVEDAMLLYEAPTGWTTRTA